MADLILNGIDDKILITICCSALVFFITGLLFISRFQNFTNFQRIRHQNMRENHISYNEEVCPICLSVYKLAVETNCGHKFCGLCLRNYFNRTPGDFSLFGASMSCPLCRQNVNILLLNFTSEELQYAELEEERNLVERTVHEYNIRFAGESHTIWNHVMDCPVLIKHMFFDFFTFGGLVWMFRLRVMLCCLGAFVYLFNPLDVIPEAIFGIFGFLDDIIVFLLCVIYVSIVYRRVVIRRAIIR